MRRLKILILIISIAVIAVFTIVRVREYATSDYQAPVITARENHVYVSVSASEEDLLADVTAMDNLDGDVTDTLVLVSKTKFITKGTLRANYAAFDKNNNVGTYTREVTYTDYVSPRFSMDAPLRFQSGSSSYDYLSNVTAEDCLDGDLTQQIKVSLGSTEAQSDASTYRPIHLQVTNSAGDTSSLDVYAYFLDYSSYTMAAPALSNYVVYTGVGVRPQMRDLLIGVRTGKTVRGFSESGYDPTTDVSISDGSLDVNTPGVYIVTYQLSRVNNAGVRSDLGTTDLIVIVEE